MHFNNVSPLVILIRHTTRKTSREWERGRNFIIQFFSQLHLYASERKCYSFCCSTFKSFLVRHLFFTLTARSGHTVETQQGTISRVYYNKEKTTRMDWANSFTGSLRCFWGEWWTKTQRNSLKKSCSVGSPQRKKKLNETEKNGDEAESRGGGQWSLKKEQGGCGLICWWRFKSVHSSCNHMGHGFDQSLLEFR